MKFSQFNTIIPIGNIRHLLYNAFTDKFMTFNNDLYPQIDKETVGKESDFEMSFYTNLIETGAILEDNVNEMALVKEMSYNAINNLSEYILIVNPTTNCNFNCWYCYETHNKQAKMTEQTLGNIKNLISTLISERTELKTFHLSFFGGEPLLYFNQVVKPLMECTRTVCEANETLYSYAFTTNGYLINQEMIKWFSRFKEINFQITFDGGREFHDKVRYPNSKKGSYDKIINNVKSLLSIQHYVTLRINYTANNIDSVSSIYEDIKDITTLQRKKLVIDLHRVWQDNQNDNLEDKVHETIMLFRGNGFNAKQQLLDNVRDPCYADKANEALINYNGDVFSCTARDFETFPRDGYLTDEGVIVWENDSYNKRINAKFQNEPCLTCRIMPLCCGGCSKKAIDSQNTKQTYCINNFNEKAKDKVVLNRFYELFMKNHKA